MTIVFGVGYGFAQSKSTRRSLKACYFSSFAGLFVSLTALLRAESNLPAGGGEDSDNPLTYYHRLCFMISEYATFFSGVVAIAYPRLTKFD